MIGNLAGRVVTGAIRESVHSAQAHRRELEHHPGAAQPAQGAVPRPMKADPSRYHAPAPAVVQASAVRTAEKPQMMPAESGLPAIFQPRPVLAAPHHGDTPQPTAQVALLTGAAVAPSRPSRSRDEPPFTLDEVMTLALGYLEYATTLHWSDEEGNPDPSGHPDIPGLGIHELVTCVCWACATHVRIPCLNGDHGHPVTVTSPRDIIPGHLSLPCSPRLGFFARLPNSGKTETMRAVLRICANPHLPNQPTGPVVPRLVGEDHHTVALDEAKLFLQPGRHQMALSVLLDGYLPGGTVDRVWRNKSHKVAVFGPVTVAALVSVLNSDDEDLVALWTRFIKIHLDQAPDGYDLPMLDEAALNAVANLPRALSLLLMPMAKELRYAAPATPPWMKGRMNSSWRVLYSIADLAGGRWPALIRDAASWLDGGDRERELAARQWDGASRSLSQFSVPGGLASQLGTFAGDVDTR